MGLRHLPAVASISRRLSTTDSTSVERLRALNRRLVLDRLTHHRLARVTLDFDGSVLSTQRHAEGTAVGFNKKKKGQRSYYPLFATIAQTREVLDRHHRPGNVHDSNGARAFIEHCVGSVREALPGTRVESRVDSAFYNEALIDHLHRAGVAFTASVPAPLRKCSKSAGLKVQVTSEHLLRYLFDSLSSSSCDGSVQGREHPAGRHFQTGRIPTISRRR